MSQKYLSTHLAKTYNEKSQKNKIAWFVHNYEKFMPKDNRKAVLEIGPGYGEIMDYLIESKNYKDYTAIDNSADVVSYCCAKHPDRVSHIQDLRSFLVGNSLKKYSAVIMLHVLEHIPKDEIIPTIELLRDALDEGGVLIVEVPNIANPIVGVYMYHSDFTHQTPFTTDSLLFVTRQAGFSDIEIVNCVVPVTGVFRAIQRLLQFFVQIIIKVFFRVYLPSLKINCLQSIGMVARK